MSDLERFECRVTIDLDAKDYAAEAFRLRAVRIWHNLDDLADHVDVHVSSSGLGLHFVGWFEERLPFHEKIQIRAANGDDPRRVWMDCQRWLNGLYTDVLFTEKSSRPFSKERRYRDVYDAIDAIDGRRNDANRMERLVEDGHKGAPDLARKARRAES